MGFKVRKLLAALVLFTCPAALAQETATETRELRIHIQPVFYVETDADAEGDVKLSSAAVSGGQYTDTSRVRVHTNSGRPYRVTHRLEQAMLSNRGSALPERQILFTVSDGERGGRSGVTSPQPLTQDPAVIFTSSDRGDADEFTISYFTTSQRMVAAGTYRAKILIDGELR